MERRRFIEITAASAVGVAVAGTASLRTDRPYARALAQPDLLALLGKERTAEIGRTYCAQVPQETTIDALTTVIDPDVVAGRRGSVAALRERVSAQIQNDFVRGHTVQINGWILAKTEARQCALYSLLTP